MMPKMIADKGPIPSSIGYNGIGFSEVKMLDEKEKQMEKVKMLNEKGFYEYSD
jgi:hypothetical protein